MAEQIETAEAEAKRRYQLTDFIGTAGAHRAAFVAGAEWQASRPPIPPAGLRVTREAVRALADDMQERSIPGDGDSPTDTVARRQIREDVGRIRALLTALDVTVTDEVSDRG